jgi:serine/threonine-protein kinase
MKSRSIFRGPVDVAGIESPGRLGSATVVDIHYEEHTSPSYPNPYAGGHADAAPRTPARPNVPRSPQRTQSAASERAGYAQLRARLANSTSPASHSLPAGGGIAPRPGAPLSYPAPAVVRSAFDEARFAREVQARYEAPRTPTRAPSVTRAVLNVPAPLGAPVRSGSGSPVVAQPHWAPPAFTLGEPLLPERAHDPRYYPGISDEPPAALGFQANWRKWVWYGAAGIALIAGGLGARALWASPEPWTALIETKPADARASIDGQPLSGISSPYKQEGLAPGEHVLTVEHPGFVGHHQPFVLGDKGGQRDFVIVLESIARAVEPTAAPTHGSAEAAVVAPAEDAPSSLSALLEEHARGTAAAREPRSSRASTRGMSKLEIAKQRRSERRAARVAQRFRARKGLPAREGAASTEPAALNVPAIKASSGTGKMGTLQINSRPWSEISVDGRPVGNTPQRALQLSAGRHKIKLTNPDLGLSKTIRIKIKAGETVTKIETLTE